MEEHSCEKIPYQFLVIQDLTREESLEMLMPVFLICD